MPFEKIKQSNRKKNVIDSGYDPRCPKPYYKNHLLVGYGCSICDIPPAEPPSDPESDDETEYQPYLPNKVYKNFEILCDHLLDHHNLIIADNHKKFMASHLVHPPTHPK